MITAADAKERNKFFFITNQVLKTGAYPTPVTITTFLFN